MTLVVLTIEDNETVSSVSQEFKNVHVVILHIDSTRPVARYDIL